MADFTDLRLSDGSGPEHVNRFRVYFKVGPNVTPPNLLADFLANFPKYFNPKNIADVCVGERGNRTLKFTLHVNGPRVHDDWVAVQWQKARNYSADFAVQTLKREFADMTDVELEALMNLAGAFGPPGAGPAGAAFAGYANKFHFLAGRRSWVICDASHEPSTGSIMPSTSAPEPGAAKLFFLETAAVERESKVWFEALEDYPLLSKLMANYPMRELIVILWTTLLSNYVNLNQTMPLDAPAASRVARWDRKGAVYWTTDKSERDSVCQLHPFLGS